MKLESIDQVEKALTRLYEGKREACRASLFNLVVWAPSAECGRYLHQLVGPLTEKFPCRIIFMTLSDIPKIEIDVSINLKPNMACDLIEIAVPKAELDKLPFLLLPHFLPDIPIVLLWGQDPTLKSELYETLFPYATRVIFDSGSVENLDKFATHLIEHPEAKLRDINWSLLTGWRQTLSRIFDAPENLPKVQKATSVTILYCQGSAVQTQLLKGWLKSKYNLSSTLFNFAAHAEGGLPGDVLSFDLITGQETGDFQFSFLRKDNQVLFHMMTSEACEIPQSLPLNNVGRGFHFWRQLLFEPASKDYPQALKNC